MSSPPPPQVYATGGTLPGAGQQQQHQLAISNGVLLAAVVFLFMVVVFVFLLYLYAKRYLGANPLLGPPSTRFIFVDDVASPLAAATRGLPPAVLHALPVTVHSKTKQEGDEVVECAVCLSEVGDGETVRALPKCGHAFHVDCIDVWFRSRDTCPLCRAPVVVVEAAVLPRVPREGPVELPPVVPANVLFFGGTHGHDDDVTTAVLPPPIAAASASTSSGRRKESSLVIDIPTRAPAATSSPPTTPLPTSRMPEDMMRSPVSARLRSLRRLLSRGKQAVSVGSPRGGGGDIEQGFDPAVHTPKTPKTPRSNS